MQVGTNTVPLKNNTKNYLDGLLKISRESHYQNYFNKNKKFQEPCGKGSMKLYILKKIHKTNSPSSLLVDNETITNISQMTAL